VTAAYFCLKCLAPAPRYRAKCPACGAFNSLATATEAQERGAPVPLSVISDAGEHKVLKTSIAGLDEIASRKHGIELGGVYLLSGDPGAGKSTAAIQVSGHISKKHIVLYASLEEPEDQLRARADRLGVPTDRILIVRPENTAALLEAVDQCEPAFVVTDSLKGMRDRSGEAIVAIVEQIYGHAHESETAWLLINHIIKSGEAAGSEALQHAVDATLHLSSDGNAGSIRTLIAHKNRFGPSHRPAFLMMDGKGLVDVADATQHLLAGRVSNEPGSVVAAVVLEDAQSAILVEVQAMTSFVDEGDKRALTAVGYPSQRLKLLLGVLDQKAGVKTSDLDVSVALSGGLKVSDPGLDLPVALAVASAARGRAVDPKLCVWGEIGLIGEVRSCREQEARERETVKAGYKGLRPGRRLLRDVLAEVFPEATRALGPLRGRAPAKKVAPPTKKEKKVARRK
jgi:DNA repair protein RadA/Sms